MDDSSSKRNRASPGPSNPRRKPAADSVSLVHPSRRARSAVHEEQPPPSPPSAEDESSASSMRVDAASDIPAKPVYQKDSSGESSNPEKWFEKSNNNVKTSTASFADDDPPFFLRTSSSENTPPELLTQRAREAKALANQPIFPEGTAESSSDEYRSVIDDLTIENKRLKRRLQKFERQQNTQLYNDALFEVRFHGLPSEKRQELEELLRNFVTKVGTPHHQSNPSNRSNPSASVRESTNLGSSAIESGGLGSFNVPSSLLAGPSSSSHSHSRFVDSGYASLSASGKYSAGLKAQSGSTAAGETAQDRAKDIHNYLSEIPVGLLPSRSGPMTEKEKKKVVVRKLEQLFAGRDSSGAHHQPKQQERVAQSAARHDRRITEAAGAQWQPEGAREARIMTTATTSDSAAKNEPSATSDSQSKSDNQDVSMIDDDNDLFEQRPTRPLDLDPHRAQIPAENIKYIRHLGFSPPDEIDLRPKPDGHGWIHLNVLTNMAQLHFMNVTSQFVQKSISDYSKMLELSSDGRKVRWKGGRRITISSSSSSPDQEVGSTSSLQPKQLSKLSSGGSLHLSEGSAAGRHPRNKFAYSPLFHTREDSEADTGMDDEMNYQIPNLATTPSGLASSSKHNAPGKQRAAPGDDNAPLIFYQNFGFYTDLSGDPLNRADKNRSNYKRMLTAPVGDADLRGKLENLRKMQYEKGPLSQPMFSKLPSSRDESSASPMETSLKGMPPYNKGNNESSSSSLAIDPIDLEASGIGGVQPADNFAISVRSRQQKGNIMETPSSTKRSKPYPIQIRNALSSRSRNSPAAGKGTLTPTASASPRKFSTTRPTVQREIIGSRQLDLPASALPAAVFFHHSSDDEEDDDDDINNFGEDEDTSETDEVPKSAPQHMDWAAGIASKASSGSESEDEDDVDFSDDDDDSSDEVNNKIGDNSHALSARSKPSTTASKPSQHAHQRRQSKTSATISGPSKNSRNQRPIIESSPSNESMDLLAAARRIEPESIRRREREFDAIMADRFGEEIPAGSSAATADGGSGFASPAYEKSSARSPHRLSLSDDSASSSAAAAAVAASAASAARGEMPPPLAQQYLAQMDRTPTHAPTATPSGSARQGLKRTRRSDEGPMPNSRSRKSPKVDRSDSSSS